MQNNKLSKSKIKKNILIYNNIKENKIVRKQSNQGSERYAYWKLSNTDEINWRNKGKDIVFMD